MKYKPYPSESGLYFVTSSIVKHKKIFLTDAHALIPLQSLKWFREQGYWKLFAFCLMPNHLHIIVQLIKPVTINKVMGRFHIFTGHHILDQLIKDENNNLINFFASMAENQSDRIHRIWGDAVSRPIENQTVLIELFEYTHSNPVNKGWDLVSDRAKYLYSSACYYDNGTQPIIPVDDINEIM